MFFFYFFFMFLICLIRLDDKQFVQISQRFSLEDANGQVASFIKWWCKGLNLTFGVLFITANLAF